MATAMPAAEHNDNGSARDGAGGTPARSGPTVEVARATVVGGAAATGSVASDASRPEAPPEAASYELRILASAIFTSGSLPLRIGSRYILAMRRGLLEIRGPIDDDPAQVVVGRPIGDLDVVGVSDGLLITERRQRPDRLALSFSQVMGRTAEGVERLVIAERDPAKAGRGGRG